MANRRLRRAGLTLAPFLLAPLVAQTVDDPDVSVDPFPNNGAHCFRMTQTDDGRIVAAWAVADAGNTPDSEEIAVGVSDDGGHTWKLLWDARSNGYHRDKIADLAIAVEPVRGLGAVPAPRVYVVAERHEMDPTMRFAVRRFVEVYDGPLNAPWSGYRLRGTHVHGQFASQAGRISPSRTTQPSIALPLYYERGVWQPMVVIAYRWYDQPGPGLYLSTPFQGARGRMVGGRPMLSEWLAADWTDPCLAADPAGRVFAFAVHDRAAKTARVMQLETALFRSRSFLPYADDLLGSDSIDPRVAMEGSTVVLTARTGPVGKWGERPLVAYRNRNGLGWDRAFGLHAESFSRGEVVLNEGRMFVTAHCRPDNSGAYHLQHAFQAGIHATFPSVSTTVVGDRQRYGHPGLAHVGRGEPCAFGCGEEEDYFIVFPWDEVLVDPAR